MDTWNYRGAQAVRSRGELLKQEKQSYAVV
jgi:hypothetical protein